MGDTLHPAFACHSCGEKSPDLFITDCGCPYHISCVPVKCFLHGRKTIKVEAISTPILKTLTKRELLRTIQAAALKGVSMAELLLKANLDDVLHLESKGLLFFSPHRTAVFDARCLSVKRTKHEIA